MPSSIFAILDDKYITVYVLPAIFAALGGQTLQSILGSYICFNIKEAAEHGVDEGTCFASHPTIPENMEFSDPLESY